VPRILVALVVVALPFVAGCPGEECGIGGAAADGLTLTGSGVDVRYQAMTAGENNDCPDASAPVGVISVTIAGIQVGTSSGITFCVGRPDNLDSSMPLVYDGAGVEVVDVNAEHAGCTLRRNPSTPPTGTARATGICDNGVDPAGFALVVDGQVTIDRTCGPTMDTIVLDLAGTIAVMPQ
jgi:hypothetical protein